LSSLIATEFGDATGLHLSALFGLGLVLFLFALVINIFARLMVWRVFKVTGGIVE
jgi:phosphate transport system permease protein